MRRLLVNADDFGLSPGVNRGILAAFRDGILTSTTMLVNLPCFDDAVSLAVANPGLPVGIHLSLLWGSPVSDPATVPSLVERNGLFPRSLAVLVRRYFLGGLQLDQVRTEFRAQIERFKRAGLTPTHVDTHKHVHCLPGVLDALADVAKELSIQRVAEDKVRVELYCIADGYQSARGIGARYPLKISVMAKDKALATARQEGATVKELRELLGVNRARVYQLLKLIDKQD